MSLFSKIFGARKPTVLAIDDNFEILELLKAVLDSVGFQVEISIDSADALSLIRKNA